MPKLALQVVSGTAVIDLSGSATVQLRATYTDDKGKSTTVLPDDLVISGVELKSATPSKQPPPKDVTALGNVKLDAYQSPTRPHLIDREPVTAVWLEATYTDVDFGGKKVVAPELKIDLHLGWPDGWPYVAPGGNDVQWSHDSGPTAVVMLWDVLAQMPDSFRDELTGVTLRRQTLSDRSFCLPILTIHAEIADYWVKAAAPGRAGGPSWTPTENQQFLSYVFAHELSHGVMFKRCGGAGKALELAVVTLVQGIQAVLLTIEAAGLILASGGILAVPLLPLALIEGYGAASELASNFAARDAMCDYSDAIGWYCNAIGDLDIPILGMLTLWWHHQSPNMALAFRNAPVGWFFGNNFIVHTHSDAVWKAKGDVGLTEWTQEWDDPGPDDAKRNKVASEAGAVSFYATTDPHEDWAESCSEAMFGKDQLTAMLGADSAFVNSIDAARHKFIDDLIPPKSKKIVPGTATGRYEAWLGNIDGRVFNAGAAPPHPDAEAALRKLAESWQRRADLWNRAERVFREIGQPMEEPAPVDLLRLMELHGDGLLRYRGIDDPSREGNLLVDRKGNLWMAIALDENGRIGHAMGHVELGEKPGPNTPLQEIARDEIRFQWNPDSDARVFAKAHPSYGDVNAALTQIVGWWGREQDEIGQALSTPGGFFAAALRAAGIMATVLPLPANATLRDIRGYALSHGDGLVPWRPGDRDVLVGDWVLLYTGQTWGLVTRTTDADEPVDIVTSDSLPTDFRPEKTYAEQIGEVKGARMYHGLDPAHVRWKWRPSTEVRYT